MDDTSPPDGVPIPRGSTSGSTVDSIGQSSAASDAAGEAGQTVGLPPDPRVQAALARLARLDELDVHEHVEVYDAIHRDLRDALAGAVSGDPSVPG